MKNKLKNTQPIRPLVEKLLNHPSVTNSIIALIIINAILLGLETSPSIMASVGDVLLFLDHLILFIFVIEIAARIYVYRAGFWKDPWSLFDFFVVMIALIPSAGPFAVLRALRVLRVLRLLTIIPAMRKVIGALVSAVPGLGSIALVLLVFYYVFAVIATNIFAAAYPEWFGSLGRTLYTLFQIMTLESWSMGVARPVMSQFPYAWTFFIPFILVATFTMLNLFIAIIVNAMQNYQESTQEKTVKALHETQEHIETDFHSEIHELKIEIQELKQLLTASQKKSEAG